MTTDLATFFGHRLDIVTVLFQKELKIRYKSMTFGYFWSIGNPLAQAVIFYFVFKSVMNIQVPNFALFLLSGLFPWQWFVNSVGAAPTGFVNNASLIKKVKFDRNLLPFAVVLQDALHFFISIPILLILMAVYRVYPQWNWLWLLPSLMALQLAYTYGLALLIATLTLFFRDLERIVQISLMFLFYLTPIAYQEAMVPQKYHFLLYLNPMAPLLAGWRSLFLGQSVGGARLLLCLVYAVLILLVARWAFKKLSWRFAEIL